MSKVEGLAEIVLWVADMESALEFYRDRFGLEVMSPPEMPNKFLMVAKPGGIPELIEPGADGDIVPPNDAAALGAALRHLAEDPARAHAMGAAGRAKVERAFTSDLHLERLWGLYDEARARAARSR